MKEPINRVLLREKPVIAIDGPSGAGKSTVARLLAKRLGFTLVDTGALYRGVALAASESGIGWHDGAQLGEMVRNLHIGFQNSDDGIPRLLIDSRDRSRDIRTEEISMGASDVSKHEEVRSALLHLQRRLGKNGGVILEGRDIGTVVFPDAELKFFLTADVKIRARRRMLELKQMNCDVKFECVLEGLQQRDEQDRNRSIAPLRKAQDAVKVDTTTLSIEGVVDRLAEIVQQV